MEDHFKKLLIIVCIFLVASFLEFPEKYYALKMFITTTTGIALVIGAGYIHVKLMDLQNKTKQFRRALNSLYSIRTDLNSGRQISFPQLVDTLRDTYEVQRYLDQYPYVETVENLITDAKFEEILPTTIESLITELNKYKVERYV